MTEEQAKPEMQEEKLEQLDLEQPSTEAEAASADQTVEQAMEELSTEQKLLKELEEVNDKYLRLLAEFDNFRRRTAKERIELIGTANANTLKSMLSILDDFDRAQKAMESTQDVEAVKEGIKLVHHKMKTTLAAQGLKEMENSVGQTFDTDRHEAITNIPAGSEEQKGKVMDEVEKGYLLNETVIRFAKVVVGA